MRIAEHESVVEHPPHGPVGGLDRSYDIGGD
jgi:hypothetical protein